jgi:hypothetical protein
MIETDVFETVTGLLRNKMPAEAWEASLEAASRRPGDPGFVGQLGQIFHDHKQPAQAVQLFGMWTEMSPGDARAWERLGTAWSKVPQFSEALEAYERSLRLDLRSRAAWNNLGSVLYAMLELPEAIRAFRRAQEIDPHYAGAHVNEGITRLLLGEEKLGWLKFEYRWMLQGLNPQRNLSQPLWRQEMPIEGKRLFVHAEQGLGDTLHFCRYAAALRERGAEVVLGVQPSLHSLLQRLPGVESVIKHGDVIPPIDLHCPLMSIPLALGSRWNSLEPGAPYLTAEPSLAESWKSRLPQREITVGLVWRGNIEYYNDQNRSIPLEMLRPALACRACSFVNLQLPAVASEAAELSLLPNLVDPTAQIRSFEDTAALLNSLDLLISVDTSVAHLAGALGRPVWILLPYAPDWRWGLGSERSALYPSARLFRQPAPGQWGPVVDRVRSELDQLCAAARGG